MKHYLLPIVWISMANYALTFKYMQVAFHKILYFLSGAFYSELKNIFTRIDLKTTAICWKESIRIRGFWKLLHISSRKLLSLTYFIISVQSQSDLHRPKHPYAQVLIPPVLRCLPEVEEDKRSLWVKPWWIQERQFKWTVFLVSASSFCQRLMSA